MKNLALLLLSVGYKKILHFLRLDNREIDFIKRYFLKRFLGWILVVGGNDFKISLISLREWV
ncbi:hypothetical protein EC589_03225 [Helicobacter pylori]|uniref:Uncharacterized protein n=1 Tax=Helicobacter pylori TaxID=210 RepID=A0AB37V0E5_HELPX|nr:hypothetical protein [Helicobacter pylori]RVZ35365.1 hypothetical protein EC547_02785 [Helicobacter pylori]RVZ72589.1 hypothetical protein EC589_03225 [Helicobacter pylori]